MQSRTEKTIREHNPRDAAPNRILVKGNDGLLYPKNLDTNYISRFPDRFRGFLGCGSINHVFHACPQRENPDMNQKLFKDLWAIPAATPTSNINVLSTQTNPPSQSSINKSRFYTIFACVNNHTSSS